MNALPSRTPDEKLQTIIKLAILAVGGQGGGVLTSWIESVARAQGYCAQATSVAGVAQRTGATIYYIEMAPIGAAQPVFSLAPTAGDVDIMIAAEMMEAGRSIMRGFVTPDRTTLIASTHRALAVSEKMVPGDGIASSDEVKEAAKLASDQLIMFDMERVASENGSVISSALFGALAASNTLPFPREAFEDAIRASGKGVTQSLKAFDAAFKRAKPDQNGDHQDTPENAKSLGKMTGPQKLLDGWATLQSQINKFSDPEMVRLGLQKVVDFQDLAYGQEYIDRVSKFHALHPNETDLIDAAAKYIANAMCYDDIIRVADRKTRSSRFARISDEMKPGNNPIQLTEFFHPRGEEMISLLPATIGKAIEKRPKLLAWIDRRLNKGRRVRTHKLSNFVLLYFLGALRRTRRKSLRHAIEQEHLNNWQNTCLELSKSNASASTELLKCRRLIKGYSDTHSRGLSKFARVMDASKLVADRPDAADWIKRLREAALSDEKGTELDGAIKTIHSFV